MGKIQEIVDKVIEKVVPEKTKERWIEEAKKDQGRGK